MSASDGSPPVKTGTPKDVEAARLERLVTVSLMARGVEGVFDAWLRQGKLGKTSPAGSARTAIIGATLGLHDDDLVFGTARDLPAALVRGMGLTTVFQQALGVAGDPALGRALPGAVRDLASNVTLSDSSPAAHLVHATGFGQASQLDDGDRVALAFMGAAAQANGEVHAAFNFAAVSKARVIFLARGPLAGEVPLVDAAPAWGLHAVAVDGNDGMAVWTAVEAARTRAIAGMGPTVIDARLGPAAAVGVGGNSDETKDARRLQMIGDWTARRATVIAALEAAIEKAAADALSAAAMPIETLAQHLFE